MFCSHADRLNIGWGWKTFFKKEGGVKDFQENIYPYDKINEVYLKFAHNRTVK